MQPISCLYVASNLCLQELASDNSDYNKRCSSRKHAHFENNHKTRNSQNELKFDSVHITLATTYGAVNCMESGLSVSIGCNWQIGNCIKTFEITLQGTWSVRNSSQQPA